MKKIRSNVFETNSSSTHAICIPKEHTYKIQNIVTLHENAYGREHDVLEVNLWDSDILDYFYTACKYLDKYYETDYMSKLYLLLDKYDIEYNEHVDSEYPGIDHALDLKLFIADLFNDEDLLLTLLFNKDSKIFTGSDECDYHLYDSFETQNKNVDELYDVYWTGDIPHREPKEERFRLE